jgi:hypothetical protein
MMSPTSHCSEFVPHASFGLSNHAAELHWHRSGQYDPGPVPIRLQGHDDDNKRRSTSIHSRSRTAYPSRNRRHLALSCLLSLVSYHLHSQEQGIFPLFQIPRRSGPPHPRWPDNQGSKCRECILWYVLRWTRRCVRSEINTYLLTGGSICAERTAMVKAVV